MTKLTFNNRDNISHVLEDGSVLWASRSVAVSCMIIARHQKVDYVCLALRGSATPDEVGKWCLIGGYLDWDENAFDAARREIHEESGLDVRDELEWSYETQPWHVQTDPRATRQNVTLRFFFNTHVSELPPLTNEHAATGEIDDVVWMPVQEAIESKLAFSHQEIIKLFYKRFPRSSV